MNPIALRRPLVAPPAVPADAGDVGRAVLARWFAAFLTGIALLLPTAARADRNALLDQALKAGQTDRVMQALSQALADSFMASPQLARLKPEQRERLGAAMSNAYAPSRFVQRIRDTMNERLSDAQLREYIDLTETPLAQRALEMEIAASTANPTLVEKHARSIATDPESIPRINAVRRLDLASGGTDMLLAITVSAVLSSADMQRRLQASEDRPQADNTQKAPPDPQRRRAQLPRDELEQLTRSLRPKVHREVINGGLFAYRWLPLEELNEYVALQERSVMRMVSMLINEAIGSVYMIAQTEALERILLELQGRGETPA